MCASSMGMKHDRYGRSLVDTPRTLVSIPLLKGKFGKQLRGKEIIFSLGVKKKIKTILRITVKNEVQTRSDKIELNVLQL